MAVGREEAALSHFSKAVDMDPSSDKFKDDLQAAEAKASSPILLPEADLFAQFDKDGNGRLDRNELSSLFQALGHDYSNEALDAFMKVK